MAEQQQGPQPDDEPQLEEEVLEDLDAPPESAEEVKGGTASAEPFRGGCRG